MKPLNLIFVLIAFLAPVQILVAGNGTKLPSLKFTNEHITAYLNTEGVKAAMTSLEKTKAKVCACQILALSSTNEKLDYVAVFAEKTNNGELNREYTTAMNVLEKQKKQIKEVFYPKMKTLQKITAYTSCDLLAGRLKMANAHINLKVYEI